MAKQTQHHGRAWYVIHTYSGYEDNVARNLKQRIESMDMQDLIFDVMVPKDQFRIFTDKITSEGSSVKVVTG